MSKRVPMPSGEGPLFPGLEVVEGKDGFEVIDKDGNVVSEEDERLENPRDETSFRLWLHPNETLADYEIRAWKELDAYLERSRREYERRNLGWLALEREKL